MKPLTQERAPVGTKQARRQRIDTVLISSDDSFLIELGPLLGDAYRTHTVDSPLALGALAHRPAWIAIIDVAAISDARAAVARMAQRYPQVPIIVVAPSKDEWSTMVSRGAILAALAREELAGTQLTEALVTATARLSRDGLALDSTTGTHRLASLPAGLAPPIDPTVQPPRAASPRRFSSWSAPPLAVVIVLLSVGVIAAVWWLWPSSSPKAALHEGAAAPAPAGDGASSAGGSVQGNAPAVPSAASRSQMILELLSAARVEFHDDKLLFPRPDAPPRGDSALELYAQVLSQDPGNAEALDGIKRLWSIGRARIQGDVASGNLEDAERLIGLFRAAGMQDDILQPLSTSISAARGLEQQLKVLSGQLHAAIDGGALLGPGNDSALARLNAMRALSRDHALTLAGQHTLRAALLARAQEAIGTKHFDAAERDIGAAADLGGPADDVTRAREQLQADLQAASRSARSVGNNAANPPVAPLAGAAPTAPAASSGEPTGSAASAAGAPNAATTSAAAATPSAAAATPSAAMTTPSAPSPPAPAFLAAVPARPLAVSYPSNVQGIAGYVIVEFTLHANGTASNVSVVESTPRGVFDAVAVAAVRRGRFNTSALVDQKPQRARISLRFRPE